MRYLQTYKTFEDVNVDKSNLSNHFFARLNLFNDEFVDNISDFCLELDDLGYDINIKFPRYHKEINSDTEILPCCSIDINSKGKFLNNEALEMTIRQIQSYVSEFDLDVDVELGSDDLFVTADEFIDQYNVEELDIISILIYKL